MAIMSFLATLPSEFDTSKSQILSSLEISSLQDNFSRLLRTKISPSITKSSGLALEPLSYPSGGVICYNCHKLGHTRWECRKLLN